MGEAAAFFSQRSDGRALAVVGFSMGVYYGLALASAMPDHVGKVVIFYGTGNADFSAASAAYLGHFAADDEFEPRPYVDGMEEAMRNAGRAVTSTTTPARAIGSTNPTAATPTRMKRRPGFGLGADAGFSEGVVTAPRCPVTQLLIHSPYNYL